jgi:AcrR family transcriptional regulator
LLEAAERVIARDGSGASLDAIAAEAGVTKPMVYARVGGRAQLSDGLATRLAERLITAAGTQISSSRLDRATMAALFRTTLEVLSANRDLFLYVTGGSTEDMPDRLLFLAGTSARPLAELLAHWRERNGHDRSVAMPWAYAIIGMLNLVALWWIEEGDRPVGELSDQLAELVWSGMGAAG